MIQTLATPMPITFASIAPVLAAPVKFAVTDMEGLEALLSLCS